MRKKKNEKSTKAQVHLHQGVVISVPRVHSSATGIKMKSTDQGQFLGQSSDQDGLQGPQSTIKRRSWPEVSSPDYAFTHRWGRGRGKTGVVIVGTPPHAHVRQAGNHTLSYL